MNRTNLNGFREQCPCGKCEDRTKNCHSYCKKYNGWVERKEIYLDDIRFKRDVENGLNAAAVRRSKKCKQ